MASRRKPNDHPLDRAKPGDALQDRLQPSVSRLTTSLRWQAARSFNSARGVAAPQRASAANTTNANAANGSHPEQNAELNGVAASRPAPDAMKSPPLKKIPAMHTDSPYKRAIWLMSDAVVLTIASPFLAVWWVGRTIKRMTAPK